MYRIEVQLNFLWWWKRLMTALSNMVATSHIGYLRSWNAVSVTKKVHFFLFYCISIRLNVIIKKFMWLVVNIVTEEGFWKIETFSSPKVPKNQSIFYTNKKTTKVIIVVYLYALKVIWLFRTSYNISKIRFLIMHVYFSNSIVFMNYNEWNNTQNKLEMPQLL